MAYKIKPFCLGCHYCALECPTHAIDYQGTQYQIDPEKCVECGKCVEVCNISAIDTGKPETIVPHAPRTMEADAVILGAGAAGVIAAVKLAELTGAKIIVLEKAKNMVAVAGMLGLISATARREVLPAADPVVHPMEGLEAPAVPKAGRL